MVTFWIFFESGLDMEFERKKDKVNARVFVKRTHNDALKWEV